MYKALHLLILLALSSSLESRLYFMHVPKTAGTTLRLLLESQLSVQEIYPYRNTRTETGPIKEDLVSGHLPYAFYKNSDAHFEEAFKVTILRDPVERYLSLLRAKKKADTEVHDIESLFDSRSSPHNKYREDMVDNALCRFLSPNPRLEGASLLKSAKQVLHSFDCVIFFENFAQDVVDLFQRFEIDLNKNEIPKINSTTKTPVSPTLLNKIRKINELDIQLYEYAKLHLAKKNTHYSLRTASFENLTKNTAFIDYTFDQPLNGTGWTYRELWNEKGFENPHYRWVMDYPAEITFSLEEGHDYTLLFNAWAISSEVIPKIHVNGKEIEVIQLDTEKFSIYQGFIPKDLITQSPIQITFHPNKAFKYSDLYPNKYNRNHPPLSLAINRIQIYPLEIPIGLK